MTDQDQRDIKETVMILTSLKNSVNGLENEIEYRDAIDVAIHWLQKQERNNLSMMTLKVREYVLSIPSKVHSDVNYVSLTAYNVSEAIDKFRKQYPILSRTYVLDNIEDLTEMEENNNVPIHYEEIF